MQLSSENIRERVHAYLQFEDDPGRQMRDPLGNRALHWLVRNPPKTHVLTADMERQHVSVPAGVQWGSRKTNRTPRDMVLHNPYTVHATRIAIAAAGEQTVNRQSDLVIAGRLELKPRKAKTAALLTTQANRSTSVVYRRPPPTRFAIMRRCRLAGGIQWKNHVLSPCLGNRMQPVGVDPCP